MESVALHLKSEATRRTDIYEKDAFGRSAFNRYYYAAYLLVKESFAKLREEWAGDLPHAQIPEMLRGNVKNTLTKGKRRARRTEDHDTFNLCERAISAAMGLAHLMDEARVTRVVADYKPELLVDFSEGVGYSLNTVSVLQAQNWPYKAKSYLSAISTAWKHVND